MEARENDDTGVFEGRQSDESGYIAPEMMLKAVSAPLIPSYMKARESAPLIHSMLGSERIGSADSHVHI